MRRTTVVKLSSKGQIIIPAPVRRRLELSKGQRMEIRVGREREVIFVPLDQEFRDADAMLHKARAWFAETGKDPLAEHERRRRKERAIEDKKRQRRSP